MLKTFRATFHPVENTDWRDDASFAGYDPDYDVHLSACDLSDIPRVEAEDYCAWGERGDAE